MRVRGRGWIIIAATACVRFRRATVDADVCCPWACGGGGAGSLRMPGKTRSTRRRWPQSSSAPCSSPSSLAQVCCRRRSCSAQAACARGTGKGDAPSRGACFSRVGRGILGGRQSAGQGSWSSQNTLGCGSTLTRAAWVFMAAAVNAESSGLVTGALGGGLAFAVMVYATAGAPASCCAHVDV